MAFARLLMKKISTFPSFIKRSGTSIPISNQNFKISECFERIPRLSTVVKVTAGVVTVAELCNGLYPNLTSYPFEKDFIRIPYPKELLKTDIRENTFKQYGDISLQAARDFGLKKPLVILFDDGKSFNIESDIFVRLMAGEIFPVNSVNEKPESSIDECNVITCSFMSLRGRASVFTINYPILKILTPQELYAVIGHEAVHAQEEHAALGLYTLYARYVLMKIIIKFTLPSLFFRLPILSSLALVHVLDNVINRHMEKRADLIAAKKLGTAEDLISALEKIMDYYLQGIATDEKDLFKNGDLLTPFLDSQPPLTTRIKYLKQIQKEADYPKQSCFFTHKPQTHKTSDEQEEKELRITP